MIRTLLAHNVTVKESGFKPTCSHAPCSAALACILQDSGIGYNSAAHLHEKEKTMAISTVSTNSLADMMLSQMKEKDKKTQEEGAGFADMLAGRPSAAGARPAEAEEAPSLSAKKADPVQDFLDYMKMTPEEREKYEEEKEAREERRYNWRHR
jgi:GrpB-like predicted nucleotidyltransferase (UPF0157 family)